MNHPIGRVAARVAGLVLLLLLALPAAAAATDFGPVPATGPITATLPLLGASLKVDVSVDGTGHLSSVALDPVGTFTATVDRPHAVRFENTDGSVKVTISAWGGNTSLKAKAGSLAALLGAGTWKADLFGTGDPTLVKYTVGDNGSGVPTLVIDSVGAPAAITVTQGTPTTRTGEHGSSVRVGIKFAWGGFTKTLSIGVSVSTKDAKTSARLQISLTGRNVQKVAGTLADVLGSHTWHGTLCDGTAVGIAFQVVDDGAGGAKVTFDPATFATGADAKARAFKHGGSGFVAIFTDKRAAVLVWLRKQDDGTWKLAVGSFVGQWCKGTTIPNPTVNTPVSADATKGGDGEFHWRFWDWGWGFGHHGFGGGGFGHGGDGHGDGDHDKSGRGH